MLVVNAKPCSMTVSDAHYQAPTLTMPLTVTITSGCSGCAGRTTTPRRPKRAQPHAALYGASCSTLGKCTQG